MVVMEADERVRRLKDFLAQLEQVAVGLRPPYDERAKVWVQVVTKELAARNPMEEILQRCLSVPSWSTWAARLVAGGARCSLFIRHINLI